MTFSQQETVHYSKRNAVIGVSIFLFDAFLLVLTIAIALSATNPLIQLAMSAAAGIAISVLFVVGHDAGHQSLTPYRWLNNLLGRLTLLPSLHPYSLWILVHNQTHHRWTNLSPQDYVWTPLSRDQYRSLTPAKRLLYRAYRSWFGPLIYYFIEFWIKRIMFPSRKEVRGHYKREYVLDILLVALFAIAYFSFLVVGANAGWFGQPRSIWNSLCFGAFVPFLVWNTTMSFVVYLHHTHPEVTWYNDEREWKHQASQSSSAVHVVFPGPVNLIFHWIMEHNAHHARPSIPLYNLKAAQHVLESQDDEDIIVFHWTPRAHLDVVRRCKLYDYDAKRWMDFRGNYTSGQSVAPSHLERSQTVLSRV